MYQDQENMHHTCILQTSRIIHTHMHQSQGSRKIDKCIIHACINASYSVHHSHVYQDQDYMHHTYIHQGQGSYINGCFRIKAQDHRYVHHSHMHHIYISEHMHSGCIRLLESPCSFVRPSGTKFQPHHAHMHQSRIEEH